MVRYRTFLNTDPPALAVVWNDVLTNRGAVALSMTSMLEHFVFAKLYFDPSGLLVAEDDSGLVGFAHAAFGPRPDRGGIDPRAGVLALLAVCSAYQRRGIASELLRRSEDFLHAKGAETISAGGMAPSNPFYFGLYGGSSSPGFLESDSAAAPFFQRMGYSADRSCLVLQRRIDAPLSVADGRFPALRRRYDIKGRPRPRMRNWWEASVCGPIEVTEFCLEEKVTGQRAAQASVWEMETFGHGWNESAIGIIDLEVHPELRRQGLAKFLLAQMFRYLQDQFYSLVEVQIPIDNEPAHNLFQGLGLEQIDIGHTYRLKVSD